MNVTGWNMTTVNNFYNNATDPQSFGYQLQQALIESFEDYDCVQSVAYNTLTKNCSAEFLAYAQWGASAVTLNPPYNDSFYFPANTSSEAGQTLSVTYWQVPGVGVEPEYFFYSQFVYNPFGGV